MSSALRSALGSRPGYRAVSAMIDVSLLKQYGMTGSSHVLVKINLADPPAEYKPKADPRLLQQLIRTIIRYTGRCTVCECAQGRLEHYMRSLGFGTWIDSRELRVLDLDLEPDNRLVTVTNEFGTYALPECLREYDFRIAFATASKREQCVFSNCVKLFVGIIPYRTLQLYSKEFPGWRPKLHMDLHNQICGVYQALTQTAPFHLFLSGGNAYKEGHGKFSIGLYHASDAVALDLMVLHHEFRLPIPLYLQMLSGHPCPTGDKTALVMVDVQEDYCGTQGYYARKDQGAFTMGTVAKRLLAYAEHPPFDYVLRSAMVYKPRDYADEPCVEGTPGTAYYGSVHSDLDFLKREYSCFSSPEFCDFLRTRQIGRIVLAGFQTSFCVYATAVTALKLGFTVEILRDFTGDRKKHENRAADMLKQLQQMGCILR